MLVRVRVGEVENKHRLQYALANPSFSFTFKVSETCFLLLSSNNQKLHQKLQKFLTDNSESALKNIPLNGCYFDYWMLKGVNRFH